MLHPDGSTGIDLAFTEDVMAECRRLLGERCVLSNNSIRMPAFGGWMQDMYCSMAAAGGERSFQTANEWRVGDLEATIEWAIDHGAGAIELPGGFTDMLNRDQMVDLDQRLERATIRAASPSSC